MSNGGTIQPRPVALIWMPIGKDAALASSALAKANIQAKCCCSVKEVRTSVSQEDVGVLILAKEALTSQSLPILRRALEQQPPWSDLPIIFLTASGSANEQFLAKVREIQALGKAVLLERPLRSITLIAAVESSFASRQRQYQLRDYIAQLEQAHQKLAHANNDLKQFAFAASHDLQEPLRMVNAFTQLLMDRHINRSDTKAQQYAEFVRNGVRRMDSLLEGLLNYSRVIHEGRTWATERFELGLALSDAVAALQTRIAESNARIVSDIMPSVYGDRIQLSLVFQNLLGNSIKYSQPDVAPLVEISSSQIGNENVIRVRDNGIGFKQQYADRIFDLFQRLSNTEKSGTGLGLAISKRIVERHGGRIWAESTPGTGSTFLFTLPVQDRIAEWARLNTDSFATREDGKATALGENGIHSQHGGSE